MARYNTNPTFGRPVQMATAPDTTYSGKPVQMPTPTAPQNPNRKKPVQMPSPTVPDQYPDTTYSDWTPVQNPEAQTPAEGYSGEEAGDYNTYPAGQAYPEGYSGEEAGKDHDWGYRFTENGVKVPVGQSAPEVSRVHPRQWTIPEGYEKKFRKDVLKDARQGYAKGGYLKKFEKPAGKLKHDYDGYPVTNSTLEDGYITTNLQPQNGEDYYTITAPDESHPTFYRENSQRNNIERRILHVGVDDTANDTIYSMPSGPMIFKESPVYQNYADQYNQDIPVSDSKKIITSLGKAMFLPIAAPVAAGKKVVNYIKHRLPQDRHGGRLPLLKRQGGRIINVYY